MKTIQINANHFSRAIRICRKFLSRAGTAMAIDCKDMITIVAGGNPEQGFEATFYASDGYRAVSYTVPVTKMEDNGFVAAIRNPVFTPKDGTHVTIELGSRNKASFATLIYDEYGVTFRTRQDLKAIKHRLQALKEAIEHAAAKADPKADVKDKPKAEFYGNSRYIRSMMEAVEIANLAYSPKQAPVVHLRVNNFPNPIFAEGRGVKAIVLPSRQ